MTLPMPRRGLYAITSDGAPERELLDGVAAALKGGVALLQYRDKSRPPEQKRRLALQLRDLCHAHGVPFIVNDDIELATSVAADGVHLGKEDAGLDAARAALGKDAIVGRSCYNSLELAHAAQAEGASYVAFGRFFPSRSKPLASPATLDTLHRARAEIRLPICAIGGVTPDNGAALIEAGADLLCAIEGVFGQADPEQAAAAYARLFQTIGGKG